MGGSTGPNSVRMEAVGPPFRFALYKRTSDQVATPVDPRRHRVTPHGPGWRGGTAPPGAGCVQTAGWRRPASHRISRSSRRSPATRRPRHQQGRVRSGRAAANLLFTEQVVKGLYIDGVPKSGQPDDSLPKPRGEQGSRFLRRQTPQLGGRQFPGGWRWLGARQQQTLQVAGPARIPPSPARTVPAARGQPSLARSSAAVCHAERVIPARPRALAHRPESGCGAAPCARLVIGRKLKTRQIHRADKTAADKVSGIFRRQRSHAPRNAAQVA